MHSGPCSKDLSARVNRAAGQPSLPWRSRLVRDLAWSIGSPPLVRLDDPLALWPDAAWYQLQLDGFAQVLTALEHDPGALVRPSGRDRRLGAYFEALLAFWLQNDPRYELLARNLPVRRPRKGGGRETLGELDLLVKNRELGRVEHWEVAVKFYLGGLTRPEGKANAGWVGPGLKDRLDIKVARLVEHQLRLPSRAAARSVLEELGVAVQGSRVIMKGRLFYPLSAQAGPPPEAATGHLRGWWMRVGEFPGPFLQEEDWSWRCLSRGEWLAPVREASESDSGACDASRFSASEEISLANWPRMVVAVAGGHEVTRGFLVPDGWGAPAGGAG